MLKHKTILLLLPITLLASSTDEVDYKFQYYKDNNEVRVYSNTISAKKKINDNLSLSMSYLVDAISGASRKDTRGAIINSASANQKVNATTSASKSTRLDGITSASKTNEKRHQPSLTIILVKDIIKAISKKENTDNPTTVTITGINSKENDYLSQTVSGSFSQDLFERNTTLGFRLGKTFNKQTPASRFVPKNSNEGWSYFGKGSGKRETDMFSASLTQGITTTTVASVIWGYTYDRGYMAKPYYTFRIDDQFYDENLPAQRTSSTVTALLNQYIPVGKGLALHLNYRYYEDSWAQKSNTLEVELLSYITDNFIVKPSFRFYSQNSSFFYKDTYDANDHYLTTDLKYRGGNTYTAGLKTTYSIKDFVKPEKRSFISLFPISIDVGFDYFIRESPPDSLVLANHYQYYRPGNDFTSFWVQSGIRVAF